MLSAVQGFCRFLTSYPIFVTGKPKMGVLFIFASGRLLSFLIKKLLRGNRQVCHYPKPQYLQWIDASRSGSILLRKISTLPLTLRGVLFIAIKWFCLFRGIVRFLEQWTKPANLLLRNDFRRVSRFVHTLQVKLWSQTPLVAIILYISGENGENTQAENRNELYIAKRLWLSPFLFLILFPFCFTEVAKGFWTGLPKATPPVWWWCVVKVG